MDALHDMPALTADDLTPSADDAQSGQGVVEYAVILLLIALVVVVVLPSLGQAIADLLQTAADSF